MSALDFERLPEKPAVKLSDEMVSPTVEFKGKDSVIVRVCVFRLFGGAAMVPFRLRRSYPHRLKQGNAELLAPYDPGIVF